MSCRLAAKCQDFLSRHTCLNDSTNLHILWYSENQPLHFHSIAQQFLQINIPGVFTLKTVSFCFLWSFTQFFIFIFYKNVLRKQIPCCSTKMYSWKVYLLCYCIFSHENQHNEEVAFRGFWSTYSLNTWGQHTLMEGQEQNHGVLFLRRCWISEIDNLSENCQPLHLWDYTPGSLFGHFAPLTCFTLLHLKIMITMRM